MVNKEKDQNIQVPFKLFNYKDLSELFKVKSSTIRKWKSEGLFSILGYRKISRFHKEAIVSPEEVKKLIKKRLIPPKKDEL